MFVCDCQKCPAKNVWRDIKRKIRTEFLSISRFKFLARANMKSLLNGKFSR